MSEEKVDGLGRFCVSRGWKELGRVIAGVHHVKTVCNVVAQLHTDRVGKNTGGANDPSY